MPQATRVGALAGEPAAAPVLLNVRDFDGWYSSCENTILAVKQAAMAGELPVAQALARGAPPVRTFMLKQTR